MRCGDPSILQSEGDKGMTLYENERLDYVNDSLSLIQKTDGLTFGTDALLLAGYIFGKHQSGLEIGGGSGIISMVAGIIIGIIGFILCGINYPIYKRMLEKGKAKYAYEIVELAREISEEK